MLEVYLPAQQTNRALRENYFDYTKSGTLDVLGTTFQQIMYENPMNAAMRSTQLYFKGNTGRKLTRDEFAASEHFRDGIEVGDDGIYEGAASILASRYDEREARKLVLNRSRGGFGLGAAQIGVGLVGSMLDPLNIAASFIPVVGQARYAAAVNRVGATGARFGRGAVEGAVGATVVEPLVYGAAKYEQDQDYTIANSLMNVAFGTVLGGGLHAAFGKAGDALSRTTTETRQAMLRTAIAQVVENKPVETNLLVKADPILRNDPVFRGEQQVPENARAVPLIDTPKKGNKVPESLRPAMASARKPKTLTQFIRGLGGVRADDPNVGDVRQIVDKDPTIIAKSRKKGNQPRSLDEIGLAAFEAGYFRERPTVDELLEAFDNDYKGSPVFRDEDVQALADRDTALALKEEAERYGIDYKGRSDADFQRMLINRREAFEGIDDVPEDAPVGLTEDEFFSLRVQQQEGLDDTLDIRDFEARMAEADAVADEFDADELGVIERQNEELIADINFLIEQGAVPDDFVNDIAIYDDLMAKANDGYGPATRAAANCMVRSV
jgi:hypothetical protein